MKEFGWNGICYRLWAEMMILRGLGKQEPTVSWLLLDSRDNLTSVFLGDFYLGDGRMKLDKVCHYQRNIRHLCKVEKGNFSYFVVAE